MWEDGECSSAESSSLISGFHQQVQPSGLFPDEVISSPSNFFLFIKILLNSQVHVSPLFLSIDVDSNRSSNWLHKSFYWIPTLFVGFVRLIHMCINRVLRIDFNSNQ